MLAILTQKHCIPFLLSGPPGTGKTKTCVEAILQLAQHTVNRILVVTPSHAASDVLITRLARHLKPPQILRLNGPARTFAEVPESLAMFCYIDETLNAYSLPPWHLLMNFRVVICTTQDVSMLLRAKWPAMSMWATCNDFSSRTP